MATKLPPPPKGYKCVPCGHITAAHREHGCDVEECDCPMSYGRVPPGDPAPTPPAVAVGLGRRLYTLETNNHATATRRAADNTARQLAEIQQALETGQPPNPGLTQRLLADAAELVRHNAAWHALAECLPLTEPPEEN